jgi:putative endopeptidase
MPSGELEYKFPSLKVHKLNISQEAWWQSSSQDFLMSDREHLIKGRIMSEKMTQVMVDVLYEIFENSNWERSTKSEAQMKLKNMVCNVGWSDVPFEPFPKIPEHATFDDIILLGWQYQYNLVMKNANRPVNKREWRFISYNIVNACYSRELNTLYIPASLFYEPFLYLDEEKLPETFASLGSIIAHELYHGFDYDSKNVNYLSMLSNWWAEKDNRQFIKDSETTIALYSKKKAISSGYREKDYMKKSKKKKVHRQKTDDSLAVHHHKTDDSSAVHHQKTEKEEEKIKHYKINGRLTLSENIADIVALHISYDAFVRWWETHFIIHPGEKEQKRFFHAFALSQIQMYTKSGVENALKEDVHAIAAARVNLPLSIFPPFLNLYHVQPGDPMFTPVKLRPQFFFDQKS